MNSDDGSMNLFAKAVSMVLGRKFDTGSDLGLEELRALARELAANPDATETERVLEVMEDLGGGHEPALKVTKGVAPLVIQLDIPEAQRVLKKGRSYVSNKKPDLYLGM
ncbi:MULTISPECIES: hypothetical protein [unclassified Pseudomonas]|jgi:hypothetical protein|uniref:hypothetical protein n=1 Tax=unclassified Pseudomonas TaxID=196821 RepID=UPI0003431D99|nr:MULTISPECIES: hypothetical protein [unclassified Pseudomonas]EPA96814.1 hypothetical protein PG5_27430 [Pseudomonas sp. G5(2012)]PMZ91088.1 hypothetical protein C1X61_05770 [Pseudomonas sp. FW215-T2]PNA15790.1 hypothetical protein C1X62_03890 [Pseudomonas sp. FW215-R3]PNB38389.1 hypothetical protein C1X63_07595 [Pseudomonas sp. FW305-131]